MPLQPTVQYENNMEPILTIFAIAILCFTIGSAWLRRRSKRISSYVSDGPEDAPYRIYTDAFDVVIQGKDVQAYLPLISLDHAKGHMEFTKTLWDESVNTAKTYLSHMALDPKPYSVADLNDCAVLIMVDQSGSMKGAPISWAAANVRTFANSLSRSGVAVQVVGYTTAGWHGGLARQAWKADGQPKRPGRLCALLHIVYRDFDAGEWDETSWETMLNPDVLRENVDGESLRWAESLLAARKEANKILLVVSDGAPVDDSTLLHNGPNYLWWHWKKTITAIEARDDIAIKAVGINYDLQDIYSCQTSLNIGDDFQSAVWSLMQHDQVE
jgi:cobaltochelatase CobT